jgi:hypothetical protein
MKLSQTNIVLARATVLMIAMAVKQIDVIAGLCGIPARSEKDASNAG